MRLTLIPTLNFAQKSSLSEFAFTACCYLRPDNTRAGHAETHRPIYDANLFLAGLDQWSCFAHVSPRHMQCKLQKTALHLNPATAISTSKIWRNHAIYGPS